MKQYLVSPPVLRLPDYNKSFILQTDASGDGLGAMLLQENDGLRYADAYASRKLLPRERNYSTVEKECLAVVWAIQKFQMFLYGKLFERETYHQPLR